MQSKAISTVVLSNLLYKIPQIETLKTLNTLLADESTSVNNGDKVNIGCIDGFLKENGLQILLQVINNRIESGRVPNDSHKLSFKVFDIAILYECIQCCKSIVHSETGINHFIAFPDLISAIARCLNFQCKILSLSIITLFDHCISQSTQFATVVYGGIQVFIDILNINGMHPNLNFSETTKLQGCRRYVWGCPLQELQCCLGGAGNRAKSSHNEAHQQSAVSIKRG